MEMYEIYECDFRYDLKRKIAETDYPEIARDIIGMYTDEGMIIKAFKNGNLLDLGAFPHCEI